MRVAVNTAVCMSVHSRQYGCMYICVAILCVMRVAVNTAVCMSARSRQYGCMYVYV